MAKVIGIISGKGGVGKTTVAVNLAYALRKFRKKVLLIDMNLSMPHLSYYLGANSYEYTINDVLLGNIDILTAISTFDGIRFIPASLSIQKLLGLDFKKLEKQLAQLKKYLNVDYIILDGAPGIGREALTVMKLADEIIFVTMPYAPAINDILRCKEILKQIGKKPMKIIVNMYSGFMHEISPKLIEKLTGIDVLGTIPFDKSVWPTIVSKTPLVEQKPDSIFSIAVRKIAAEMIGKEFEEPFKFKLYNLFVKLLNKLKGGVKAPRDLDELKREIKLKEGGVVG